MGRKMAFFALFSEQFLVCQSAEGHQDGVSAGWQVLSPRLAAGEDKAEAGVVTEIPRAGHLNCTLCDLPGSCARLCIAPRHGAIAESEPSSGINAKGFTLHVCPHEWAHCRGAERRQHADYTASWQCWPHASPAFVSPAEQKESWAGRRQHSAGEGGDP